MNSVRCAMAVGVIAASALGCGAEAGEPTTNAAKVGSGPSSGEVDAPTTRGSRGAEKQPAGAQSALRRTQTPGRKPVRLPDGSTAYLPVKPSRTAATPSRSCSRGKDGDGSGTVALPPTPGVHARRVGSDRLVIRVTFAALPKRCRPNRVRLTLDVNDDPLPPATGLFPLDRVRGPLEVKIPERVRDADVIRASSITAAGASSASAAVLIAGG